MSLILYSFNSPAYNMIIFCISQLNIQMFGFIMVAHSLCDAQFMFLSENVSLKNVLLLSGLECKKTKQNKIFWLGSL